MSQEDVARWESEGGAIDRVLRILESERDSIGQYVETEGRDWCNGAHQTLTGVIHLLEQERYK